MSNNANPEDVGAGQQTPNDSSNLPNLIAFACESIIARLDIAKPVKVLAVNAGQGTPPGPCTVDVQPLVSQIDGSGNVVEQGTVYGIPVARMQGGPWTVVCDPAVGQFGFVVCSDRDMSKVVAAPGVAPPGSYRKFSISDGVFVGSILNEVGDNYLWLRSDGTFKIAAAGGLVLESNSSGKLTLTGDLDVTGEVKAKAGTVAFVTLTGHQHPSNGAPPSPGH